MKADLASRFSVAAPAIHPRAVGKLHRVTICREFSDADQIIKSEHGGTDRRPFYARERPRPSMRETTPAWPAWGEGRVPQTPCLFAPADDRNAPATPTAGWRRQLPAVQFNRSRMAQHVRMHL
jgi:hypothetical protein